MFTARVIGEFEVGSRLFTARTFRRGVPGIALYLSDRVRGFDHVSPL
jgi:hypothetical protein